MTLSKFFAHSLLCHGCAMAPPAGSRDGSGRIFAAPPADANRVTIALYGDVRGARFIWGHCAASFSFWPSEAATKASETDMSEGFRSLWISTAVPPTLVDVLIHAT